MGVRDRWGSYIGFIFACICSAVGIGNIWRFPYVVGTNGGGAFLLAYLIIVFTFGLSFMLLELAVGRYYQTSILSTLASIRKKFKWIGVLMVCVTFLILSYYMVVIGWILSYFLFASIGLNFPFDKYIKSFYPVLSFVAIMAINYFIIRMGLNKGIERFSKIGVILLISILIPLAIMGMSLHNSYKGIKFYLVPNFFKLKEPKVWSVAFGQAFFSLSIGLGTLMTYGSYIKDKHSLLKSSLIIIVATLLVAFTAGLMIFTMVFADGMNPAQGPSLIFKVMPSAFSDIQFGMILEGLFFFLLTFIGLASSLSMFQIPVSVFEDTFKFCKNKAIGITTIIAIIIGLPSALSYSSVGLNISGTPILDVFDTLFGTFGLSISATVFVIGVTWFMDKKTIMEQVNLYYSFRIPDWILTIVKFILPLLLIATIIGRLFKI